MHLEPESQGRDGVTAHSSVYYQMVYAVLKATIVYSPTIKSLFANGYKQQNDGQNLSTPGLAMAMSSKQVANTPW